MKKIVFLIFSVLLHASSPFDAPSPRGFNLSAFETKVTPQAKITAQNEKIVCRYVCDKRVYKEQKIGDAVTFYKNATGYTFKILN